MALSARSLDSRSYRSFRNTERVFRNKVTDEVQAIERANPEGKDFGKIAHLAAVRSHHDLRACAREP